MAVLANNTAIEIAPLPALASVAAVGAAIVYHRTAILSWCQAMMGAGVGTVVGRGFVAIGGYGWLLIGLIGMLFWAFDQI